jgi:hypothetical protein
LWAVDEFIITEILDIYGLHPSFDTPRIPLKKRDFEGSSPFLRGVRGDLEAKVLRFIEFSLQSH